MHRLCCLLALLTTALYPATSSHSSIRTQVLEIIDEEGRVCARLQAHDCGYGDLAFFDRNVPETSLGPKIMCTLGSDFLGAPSFFLNGKRASIGGHIVGIAYPSWFSASFEDGEGKRLIGEKEWDDRPPFRALKQGR